MAVSLAHIDDFAGASTGRSLLLVVLLLLAAALVVEHAWVKHGRLTLRHVRPAAASLIVVVLVATAAPLPGFAQDSSEAVGLPDLISDPPRIQRTRDIQTPQGDVIRVLTFDGFIHNIGTGKLEVSGNPQIEGDVQQRVFDGEQWQAVSTPTVIYETDDGHNHFHLKRAVDYALWSNDRSEQVSDSAKVGFCLVDTEQMEESYDASYLIDTYDYCSVDDPGTTDLTMGITPGWRDQYDANVTLQWIDISNISPGLYWTSAVTDPNDQIVESNEENNALVYSVNRYPVDGYVARELTTQTPAEPIRLKSNVYGTTGDRSFVIAEGPANGTLDVPVGVDLLETDTVTYTPDPGFTGTDSFSYYAHDTASLFPLEPTVVSVDIEVDTTTATEPDETDEAWEATIQSLDTQQSALFTMVDLALDAQGVPDGAPVRWYARNLPPGLQLDSETGTISGVPTYADTFESTIVLWANGERSQTDLSWIIDNNEPPSLAPVPDFSTSADFGFVLPVGAGTPGATYVGVGLPEGGFVISNQPTIAGVAQERGTFTVTVQEIIDDVVVDEVQVDWTVRSSIRPAFPL